MSSLADAIQGGWQLLRAEFDGEDAPELVTEHTTLELRAGSYSVRFQGREVDAGEFECGGEVNVHTIVLKGRTGSNAGRTIPGIYQLRGDRLRVCYGLDGIAPTEFSAEAKSQRYLASYRRLAT